MIKNYFKIAFRNLLRKKGFSVINIAGLAIGMASALLIILWIQNELNYDKFHEKKERIYEAWNRDTFSDKLQCWSTTPKVMAKALIRDFPEIETAVRVNWENVLLLTVGEKSMSISGNIVDSNFLQVFTFPLLKGNPNTVLNDLHSIAITEKLAKKLFGSEDPMGKIIRINHNDNFTVTGLLKDPPTNSRFKFEYLLSWAYLKYIDEDDENWGNNSTKTYALLKKNATLASIEPKIKGLRKKYDPEAGNGEMFLYPMERWHLYSRFENGKEDGGLITYVKLFGIIAVFILLIACINFMNLSTARSEKRAKEVGIRKVIGARRPSLIAQFLAESVLIAFIAGLLAIAIVELSLPAFNNLTDKILSINFGSAGFWLLLLSFIVFTGVIAGSYPAFYLSAFRPVKVLKGTFQKTTGVITPRKVLVVLQFTFAILLIISTIIIREQIQHARDREVGYAKNNLVYHFITGDLQKNYSLVKNDLLQSGAAVSVTRTSAPMTEGWSDSWGFEWQGKDPKDKTDFDRFCADDALVTTTGLELVKGRDFNLGEFPTDSLGIILNESAVKAMGFKEPIGQIIKDNGHDWHVIGVIKDFILQSPFYPLKPMVIEGSKGWFNVIHFKLNDQHSTADNIKKAGEIFKKYNPNYPFDYIFIDAQYDKKFASEQRTGKLATLFAGLTIFISCLGLFGLATYMAESRTKEIGVRKVLGASVSSIATLLSKDFVKLVLVAFLIASPLAWWLMSNWLEDYPYRISIQWWVFIVAGLSAVVISVGTVSFQAIKAALMNPVKSLRSE